MTFNQIYTAVQDSSFDASLLTHIKEWVGAREGEVWQYANWPLKNSSQINISVVSGTATVALPTGMTFPTQGIRIYDQYGNPLEYIEPDDFYDRYQSAIRNVSTTQPDAWTIDSDVSASVITPRLRLGLTPNVSATFTIRGWYLPICRDTASTYKLGLMSADTDRPWWPDEFHHFLVPGAIAYGGRMYNMLDAEAMEQDFKAGMERLKNYIMPSLREEIQQWGGVNSDYYS